MYIYNRINRFQSGEIPRSHHPITSAAYKIKRNNSGGIIRKKPVRASRSIVHKHKLKPLTKQNIEFLSQLGYKVLK